MLGAAVIAQYLAGGIRRAGFGGWGISGMALQARAPMAQQFSIGRVLQDSLRVLGRYFIPFVLIELAAHLALWPLRPLITPELILGGDKLPWLEVLLFPPIRLGIGILATLAILFAALRAIRGERPARSDYTRGLKSFPTVLAASIILWLPALCSSLAMKLIAAGTFALPLVMGVFGILSFLINLIFWVTIPVLVLERKSIPRGLARAAELTGRHRWHLLGLTLITGIVIVPLQYLISLVSATPFTALPVAPLTSLAGALTAALAVLNSAFAVVLMMVIYHYLRIERDGDTEQVAQVFD
jgi:hypothetical protein